MERLHDTPTSVALAGLFAGMLGTVGVTVMVALGRIVMGDADESGESATDAGISADEAHVATG